jgi:hypothetical protein
MHLRTYTQSAVTAAGLLCLTTLLLVPVPAQASRLPADPFTFVGTPAPAWRLVYDNQAANVRAALEDLRADHAGPAA